MNMIGMKFDDVDGEEPKPVQPVRPAVFGVGVWKTRGGRKAEVTKDKDYKDCVLRNYDLTGVIHFGDQAVEVTWTQSGDFISGRFHDNDLVGPWVAKAPVVEAPVAEAPVAEAPEFGVGVWRTRRGHKVEVTEDKKSPVDKYQLYGVLHFEDGTMNASWLRSGVFGEDDDAIPDNDLVGPWIEEVVEPVTFGVGVWKTREGRKAVVTDDTFRALMNYELAGEVDFGGDAKLRTTWTKNGVFNLGEVSGSDLVGPWVEEAPVAPVAPVAEAQVVEAQVFGVGMWKTRNGSIARVDIHRVSKGMEYPLIGSIINGPDSANGAEPDPEESEMTWTADGKVYSGTVMNEELDDLDLISPAVEEKYKQTKPVNEDVLNLQSLCDKQKNSIQVLEDSVKSLTGMLQVSDRKVVHLDGELTSMAVLLRDAVRDAENKSKGRKQMIEAQRQTIESWSRAAREKDHEIERLRGALVREKDSNIEETGRLNKLIAGLREENVVQGFKLSAAIDERDTEKLRAKLDLEALKSATEQKQSDTFLPAIRRMKVLLLACRIVAVLLLAAIPMAGQWIAQHGPKWMVDSTQPSILGPGTLFAAVVAWMGVCVIGFSIEGEIRQIIESQETEYWRLRNKVTPGRREDW